MPKTVSSRGWRLAVLLTLLLPMLGALLPTSAAAQTAPGWSPFVQISRADDERSTEAAVAVDKDGFAHVVWYGGSDQSNWQVFYANNRSGSFSRPKRISNGTGAHRNVDIAVDRNGGVHVVAARTSDGEINYIEGRNFGALWPLDVAGDNLIIVNLSETDRLANEPTVAVDDVGNVYFAWIDNRGGEYQILFKMRSAGQYTTVQRVSRTFDKVPQLAVTGSGANQQVHLVWQGRPTTDDRNAAFEVLYAGGPVVGSGAGARVSFSSARQLSNGQDDDAFANNPEIATDGGSNLYVVFEQALRGNRDITFATSNNNGASWTSRDLTPRTTQTFFPSVAFGLSFGRPTVTLAWEEGNETDASMLTATYDPATNSFSEAGLLATLRTARRVALGGNPSVNASVAVFNDVTAVSKIYFTTRDTGLGATPTINGGAGFTNNPQLTVTLVKQGQPRFMRFAIDRDPTAADASVPYADSFTVTAPPSESCLRSVAVQVSGDNSSFTAPTRDTITVDTAVQASVSASNPGVGDPGYTRTPQALITALPAGECTGLAGTNPPLAASNGGFSGVVPLANGPNGRRDVAVTVSDAAGNALAFTRPITVDTEAPDLTAGSLSLPNAPQPRVLVALTLSGLNVSDNLYPGGFWGVEIANTLDSNASDGSLVWSPRQAFRNSDGSVTIRNWSVASGLGRPLGDPGLANTPIQVRVRLIDGAGNPTSSSRLRDSVTLAAGYSTTQGNLPVIAR